MGFGKTRKKRVLPLPILRTTASPPAAQGRAGKSAELDFVTERIARHHARRAAVAYIGRAKRGEFRLYLFAVEISNRVADMIDRCGRTRPWRAGRRWRVEVARTEDEMRERHVV